MQLGVDFDDFVRAASPSLLRTAFLLCGDRGHAEDLLQTTLLRTAHHWKTSSKNPAAYARAVLTNLAKDRWRERGRRVSEDALNPIVHDGDPNQTSADVERIIDRDLVMRAVTQLSPGQRAVLILRYFDDAAVEEVARTLGCSVGTVKSQTHDALVRLRILIGEAQPTRESEESRC